MPRVGDQDCGEREAGIPNQAANSIADVLPKKLERGRHPCETPPRPFVASLY